jgi:peptidoglycan hydrolase-like amidase
VYRGAGEGTTRIEADSTDAAIAATAGGIRRMTADSSVARTEFSSSTGGFTAGGVFPAVIDDGDDVAGNPNHNWTANISADAATTKYGIGAIQSIAVIANTPADGNRRVLRLRITGAGGSIERSGSQFQSDWGLKSTWYAVGP